MRKLPAVPTLKEGYLQEVGVGLRRVLKGAIGAGGQYIGH